MWTTREIRHLGTESDILRKLSEVQKRNKLKTGKSIEKVTGTYIWTAMTLIQSVYMVFQQLYKTLL